MARQGSHVGGLKCQRRSQLILQREIPAHRIRCLIIKLNSTQLQIVGIYRQWVERYACKPSPDVRAINRRRRTRRAGTVSYRVVVVRTLEIERELEGIVFAQVWRISTVLKAVEEDSKSSPSHKLGIDLIGETETRGKVVVLRVAKALAVLVGDSQTDSVLGQQVYKAGFAARRESSGV